MNWFARQPTWLQATIAIGGTAATIAVFFTLTKKKPALKPKAKPVGPSAKITPKDTGYKVENLAFIDKVKDNKEAFGKKVIDIAAKLDTVPNNLMIVMNNESAGTFSPSIKNPTSTATGLIQFMEDTAKGMGTSTQALAKMSNVQQLDYVYKYLAKYKDKYKDASDLYLAVFFPLALYQKDENWQFPQWAVKANPIFDINKDGKLTKAEFRSYVLNKYKQYL